MVRTKCNRKFFLILVIMFLAGAIQGSDDDIHQGKFDCAKFPSGNGLNVEESIEKVKEKDERLSRYISFARAEEDLNAEIKAMEEYSLFLSHCKPGWHKEDFKTYQQKIIELRLVEKMDSDQKDVFAKASGYLATGVLIKKTTDYKEAMKNFEESDKYFSKILPENSYSRVYLLFEIANAKQRIGNYAESAAAWRKFMDLSKAIYEDNSPCHNSAMFSYINCKLEAGEYNNLDEQFNRLLNKEIDKTLDYYNVRFLRVTYFNKIGQYEKAEKESLEILDYYEGLLPDQFIAVLKLKAELIQSLSKQKKYGEVVKYAEEVLCLIQEYECVGSPRDCKEILENYANALDAIGQKGQAENARKIITERQKESCVGW